MRITRRNFLRKSAITAVGLSFASPLLDRVARGAARGGAAGSRVVVTINLFGGNDGLNTVVPLAQYARYRQLRPTLAIPRERVLALPNAPDFGFGPGMGALHDLYAGGKVAVFNGVGPPQDAAGLFDHEASQYVFQSADVSGTSSASAPSGWIGRYLDTVQEGILSPGVDLGGGALLVSGATRAALTITSIDEFQVQPIFDTDARLAAYVDIQNIPSAAGGVAEANRLLRQQAIEQSEIVRERTSGYEPGAAYPEENSLADSLRQCAQLITSDLGVRALAVGYDGYDTHAGQNDGATETDLGFHDYLMASVSDAVSAFHADLVAHGASGDVITLVFSEFGRRPEENNDAGTDHGYGSVALAVGDRVRGGVYGEYPSLDEDHLVLDGNVDVTTDFRSVYASVLAGFLEVDPGQVLGADFPVIDFL